MILTCPACQTQYIVPETALSGPQGRARTRSVKCAACGYGWRQSPITVTEIDLTAPHNGDQTIPSSEDAPPVTDFSGPSAETVAASRWQQARQADIAAVTRPPLKPLRFAGQIAGWLGLFMLITGITLIYLRDDLANWWPPSTLLYETLGQPAPLAADKLRFKDDVRAELRTDSVPQRLQVSGRFYNLNAHAVALPVLQARAFDLKGVWLKDWSIPLQNIRNIGGKATMGFAYSLPQVPLDAHSLTFRFVDD